MFLIVIQRSWVIIDRNKKVVFLSVKKSVTVRVTMARISFLKQLTEHIHKNLVTLTAMQDCNLLKNCHIM